MTYFLWIMGAFCTLAALFTESQVFTIIAIIFYVGSILHHKLDNIEKKLQEKDR